MAISKRSNSRFGLSAPVQTRTGEPTYGIAKKYNFQVRANLASNQIGSIPVTADFAGKPEKLAGHIYGDQGLAWVLISFNHVLNPFGGWPSLGLMVEYPKPDVVAAEL